MANLRKIILFFIIFSGVFYFLRSNAYLSNRILLADLTGVVALYSTIGLIFSFISTFAIQKEWDNWNSLRDSVREEVDSIEELWLWVDHLKNEAGERIKHSILQYLELMIRNGFRQEGDGDQSEEGGQMLIRFRDSIMDVSKDHPDLTTTSFSLFSDILRHIKDRLRFSSRHLPEIVYGVLTFATILTITLPLLIGVRDIWLDYVFTSSIATLAFAIYTVIRDLNQPLRPGGWHLTTRDYERLLARLKK